MWWEVFGSGRREADGRSADGAAATSGERRGSTDLLREGYWRVLEERRGAEVGRTAALGALPIHRHGVKVLIWLKDDLNSKKVQIQKLWLLHFYLKK